MRNTTDTSILAVRRPYARGARAALLALALFAAGAIGVLPGSALVASAAYAGLWVQVSCANPDLSPAPIEGWSSFITGTPGAGSDNSINCTPNTPMYAYLETSANAPVGSAETLQYTPPAGSTLAGGNVDVNVHAGGYDAAASGTATLYTPADANDSSDAFLQCNAITDLCNNAAAPRFSGVLALPAGRGGDLYLSAGCAGTAGQYCNLVNNGAWSSVQLLWADLLLTNSSAPAATGFGGSLLSPDAHGTAEIAFTATDPNGPGVYRVTIDIDGNAVYAATPNTNGGACVPVGTDSSAGALMFDRQQPCPQTESIDIPLATTALTDGQHELKVIVTDAAQNTSTVLDQTITTLNHPTAGAQPNTPPRTTPRTTPVYAFSLDAATRTLTRGIARLYSHSAIELSGKLKTPTGVTAAGVPVTLWTQPANGGAYKQLSQTTTNRSGAWTLHAPPGPSRLLRVLAGQAPQHVSAKPAITVNETVTPTLSLNVATPGNATLIFTGQIGITPLGKPRPLVVIETPGPNGWEAVGAPIRVGPHGGFRYTYRSSPLTLHRTFQFRAVTPATPLWQRGQSPTRAAVVR
jgi:hypothetical protein